MTDLSSEDHVSEILLRPHPTIGDIHLSLQFELQFLQAGND